MRAVTEVTAAKKEQIALVRKYGADDDMQFALAGAAYAEHAAIWADGAINLEVYRTAKPGQSWPWKGTHWVPRDPRSDLVRAAALIIAQIEQLDRARHVGSVAGG